MPLRTAFIFAICLSVAAAGARGEVPADGTSNVRVTIRKTGGQPLPDAYVSFVPPHRPSWRPAAEAVAARGRASLALPPGVYTVFAGAPGLQESTRSVRLTADTELAFELRPSVPVTGVVKDRAGRPVSGALVRHIRNVGPVALGQMSEVARRYFAAGWSTQTDATGSWTLPGPDQAGLPILITAPGFAAEQRFVRASAVDTVTLHHGSTIRATFDRTDPELTVTLMKHAEGTGDAQSAAWQRTVWTKPVVERTVVWESLPPGQYSLIARYPDPRRFTDPVNVKSVTVGEHESATVDVTLPKPAALHESLVFFVPGQNANDLITLQAFASSEQGGVENVRHAFERSSGGTLVYVRTATAPTAVFMTTHDAIIAGRSSVAPGSDAPLVTVRSGRADVTVRIAATEVSTPLPQWTAAHFSNCEFRERLSFSAPVSKDGTIDVAFPTACRSMILRVPRHEPISIRTSLAPGTRRSFGPFVLRPGGSANVHVIRAPGGSSVAGASVRAMAADADLREELVFAEGTTDDKGRVVLDGLPVGRELIFEARTSSTLSGRVSARVDAGVVASVDPLPIPEPGTLVITAKLAAEVRRRFPDARIVSIAIDPDQHRNRDGSRRTANPAGTGKVHFEHVSPGRWHVEALVEAAGSIQPIPVETIELRAGETRHLSPTVEPGVFDGYVVAGGEGVAAQVGFGDPPGPRAVRRFARTDASGRFTVVLPRRGLYNVTVTPLDRSHATANVGEIEFDDPSRPVAIQVPSGSVRVRVSAGGKPSPNAVVHATLRRSSAFELLAEVAARATTDNAGYARLDMLLGGRWLIQATAPGSAQRAEASVDVSAGSEASLDLELHEPSELAGTVREATKRVVADARVDCLFVGPSGIPQMARAETDLDGRFTIALPTPPPPRIQCGVTTASGRIAAYSVAPTTSADFVLPAETASLAIPDWGSQPSRDLFWLVARDGRMFNLTWLAAKTGSSWLPLAIRGLPAGSWKLVRISSPDDWLRLALAGGNALPSIADFSLQEGESQTIRLFTRTGETE